VRRVAILTILVLVSGGCASLPEIPQSPNACVEVYSQDRCLAMIDAAAAEVSRNRGDVTGIAIVHDPPPEGAILGGAWSIRVRVGFTDGTTHDARMCGGIPSGPACSDEPRLESRSPVDGGYRDVPAGSSPLPTVAPSAVESASSIVIETVTIPIERQGEHEIVLGEGSLPNGVWTIGSFDFAEPWPDNVALRDGVARLELRSLEPDGKPFENYYMHGWRAGVERVEAALLFDVLWFQPGADLTIRNVVVR
jgi:hypothetical protein